jgi:hypothetical protein
VLLSGNLTLFCDSVRASKVTVSNASVFAFTPSSRLFETTPELSGHVCLTILYGTATTGPQESFSTGTNPYLAIGSFSLPAGDRWRFCLSGRVCSGYFFGEIRGLFTLVPDAGSYSIIAEGGVTGFLGPSASETGFDVSSTVSFFQEAYFIESTPMPSVTPTLELRPHRPPFISRDHRITSGSAEVLFSSHASSCGSHDPLKAAEVITQVDSLLKSVFSEFSLYSVLSRSSRSRS